MFCLTTFLIFSSIICFNCYFSMVKCIFTIINSKIFKLLDSAILDISEIMTHLYFKARSLNCILCGSFNYYFLKFCFMRFWYFLLLACIVRQAILKEFKSFLGWISWISLNEDLTTCLILVWLNHFLGVIDFFPLKLFGLVVLQHYYQNPLKIVFAFYSFLI